jgi:DNA-binding GntR family transcriptional regulator
MPSEKSATQTIENNRFQRPQLLSEQVYQHLKTLILNNELESGAPIVEEHIAAQWGVSRTPLRSALTRLERDGLVEIFPHKGCFVRRILPDDIREMYQVREALEVTAVELATPLIPDEEIAAMEAHFVEIEIEIRRENYDLYIPSDAAFHAMIMKSVPNRLLITTLESIYDHLTRIRSFSHGLPGVHMYEAFQEHAAVLDAIKHRDPDAAGARMKTHIRNVTRRAIKLLNESNAFGH